MENITMYSTTWCGDCRRTKQFLIGQGVAFNEIDIDTNPDAAAQVISWSGGRRVIPTFRIECASQTSPILLYNPPIGELAQVIAGRGQ
jgi:mycoredoxin